MKRYAEAIDVSPQGSDDAVPSGPPSRFLWRGRIYAVRAVLDSWCEVSPWWRAAVEGASLSGVATERTVWRVEARAGRHGVAGVYDVAHDGSWVLVRAMD